MILIFNILFLVEFKGGQDQCEREDKFCYVSKYTQISRLSSIIRHVITYRVGIKFRYSKQRLLWGCYRGYDLFFWLISNFYIIWLGQTCFCLTFLTQASATASNIILVLFPLASSFWLSFVAWRLQWRLPDNELGVKYP